MRFILLASALILTAGCDQGRDPAANQVPAETGAAEGEAVPEGKLDRSHAGEAAPDVALEGPDGSEARLADFAGKPLLVNFWATWCAPCVVEMPTLDTLAGREQGRIKVLTVSEDRDGRDKVDAFFVKQKFKHLEAHLDPESELMVQTKSDTLPTTILYDSEGREVWRMVGMAEWDGDKAAKLIAEAG